MPMSHLLRKLWMDKKEFVTARELRAYLSKVIDKTGAVFEEIAKKRGLDFKCEKRNTDYMEFGGGNKTCTLKIWL